MPLTPGDKLGPYEILAIIGAGGMGEVYRARDTKLKRDVALKVLPAAFARDPEPMLRFQREAEVLASLNHPNIAAIYGVEHGSDGAQSLAMELVEGESPKGPMAFEDAWKIAMQIADALEYAHEKGVVHRDLKPANIKVTPDGVVKLLDFGLAKAFSPERKSAASGDVENSPTVTINATEVGVILGTAAYMAPEQAKGKRVDKRADIWSWGVMLYELITGDQLFKGDDAADTLAQVLTKEPNLERVPAQIRNLLESCLEKDPNKRLRDIGDARRLLDPSDRQFTGATSKWPWIGMAALATGLMISGVFLWRAMRPIDKPLMRFNVDLGPEAIAGARTTAIISPDGSRLVYLLRGSNGKPQIATRGLDQQNPTILVGTDDAFDPFFSPDGQWIGFFADGKLKKISARGGAAITLCDTPDSRGAAWGDDGNIIFSGRVGSLVRVPSAGGTPQELSKLVNGEVSHRWPQILPGSEAVLFTSTVTAGEYEGGSIQVLSLKTGQAKTVQRSGYFGRYLPTSKSAGYLIYIHQGTLFAASFDLAKMEVRGAPVPLLEGIAANAFFGSAQLAFSENGTFVYTGGEYTLGPPIVLLDGTSRVQPLLPGGGHAWLRFSPDGKRLATAPDGIIQVYEREHDRTTRLKFDQLESSPVWAPDGAHMVYRATNGPPSTWIRWIRADGAGEAVTLLEAHDDVRPYSFSPRGDRLAFVEANTQGSGISILPLDTSNPDHPRAGKPEPFLRSGGEAAPAFSPDGKWIAYDSVESGRPEVYVRPYPLPSGTVGSKWQVSTGGGLVPLWSGNGRELFFRSLDNQIMVASYAVRGSSFVVDKPRPWTTVRVVPIAAVAQSFDLDPDGKHIAALSSPDSVGEQKGSVHIAILLNFFDEVRRRVPEK